jgi:molecular chaperone DnaK (HSP70)
MGSDGDDRLGGADFDGAVAQFLAKEHSDILHNLSQYTNVDMEHFMASCGRITEEMPLCSVSSFHTLGEIMKIDLSEQALAATNTGKNQDVSTISRCLALPPPTSTKTPQLLCDSLQEQSLTMTLQDYNNACQSLFDRAVLPVTRLLEDLTLKPSDMDEIVMVGGTTRMPQIRQLVGHAFPNAELNTHIDPDITVAYGAASVID